MKDVAQIKAYFLNPRLPLLEEAIDSASLKVYIPSRSADGRPQPIPFLYRLHENKPAKKGDPTTVSANCYVGLEATVDGWQQPVISDPITTAMVNLIGERYKVNTLRRPESGKTNVYYELLIGSRDDAQRFHAASIALHRLLWDSEYRTLIADYIQQLREINSSGKDLVARQKEIEALTESKIAAAAKLIPEDPFLGARAFVKEL